MSLITPSEPIEAVPKDAVPGPPHDRSRRWLIAALVTVIALIAALVAVIAWPDDGDDTATEPTTTTVTTAAPTTETPATAPPATTAPTTDPPTTAPPATTPPAVDTATAVFPSGEGDRFYDPVDAARAFALDFVGFADPVLSPYRAGDARSGEVVVRARTNGAPTTVMVRQLGGDGSWWVIGAYTPNIVVTSPETGEAIGSPVTVTGSAVTWEGNVSGLIRQDGTLAQLGGGTFTGGGDMMRPFTGSIAYMPPSRAYGALVMLSFGADDGRVWEATVLRVAFDR